MVLGVLFLYLLEFLMCSFAFTIIPMVILRLLEERVNARCKCTGRLDGKTVLVTGGSRGIGLETARALARRGARLVLTCVHERTARAAAEDLIASTGNKDVHYRQLDLSSFDNIQNFAKDFNESFDKLHILVNNAGMATTNQIVTEDGIETTMQVNYVGTALLTLLLLPKLKASKPSRIVVVSSKTSKIANFEFGDIAGSRPLKMWVRYPNSKLCVLLWTKALSRRLPEGVTTNAVHPGIVNTNMYRYEHHFMNKLFMYLLGKVFKTPEEGAQTSIHSCLSPQLEGVSGQYLSECRVTKAVPAFEDFEYTEKIWEKTMSLIDSRLTDEARILN